MLCGYDGLTCVCVCVCVSAVPRGPAELQAATTSPEEQSLCVSDAAVLQQPGDAPHESRAAQSVTAEDAERPKRTGKDDGPRRQNRPEQPFSVHQPGGRAECAAEMVGQSSPNTNVQFLSLPITHICVLGAQNLSYVSILLELRFMHHLNK